MAAGQRRRRKDGTGRPSSSTQPGGWVQQVSQMAGLPTRNVVPFRRTAVTFDPPTGSDIRAWPMTFDVAETFYFEFVSLGVAGFAGRHVDGRHHDAAGFRLEVKGLGNVERHRPRSDVAACRWIESYCRRSSPRCNSI